MESGLAAHLTRRDPSKCAVTAKWTPRLMDISAIGHDSFIHAYHMAGQSFSLASGGGAVTRALAYSGARVQLELYWREKAIVAHAVAARGHGGAL